MKTINKFISDTEAEVEALAKWSKDNNHPVALSEVFDAEEIKAAKLKQKIKKE